MRRYPEPDSRRLTQRLADSWGLESNQICIDNGSIELIYALMRSLGECKALVVSPTFGEYRRAVEVCGGVVCNYWLESGNWELNITELQAAMAGVDLVFLCNPNNPTGGLLTREELIPILEQAGNALVVVDEAFIDYVESAGQVYSVIELISRFPNLLVLRSFTKFFAIPGLRLGYAAGAAGMIERIRNGQDPWSVNCIAQSVGMLLVEQQTSAYCDQVRQQVREEREALQAALMNECSLTARGTANFLLIDITTTGETSAGIAEKLAMQGILVRDCASFGISGQIRVAVRRQQENSKLVRALAALLQNGRR